MCHLFEGEKCPVLVQHHHSQFRLLDQQSYVYQVSFQRSTQGQALFTLNSTSGVVTAVSDGPAGQPGRYAAPSESFIAFTTDQGARDFGTDRLLNCRIDQGTFNFGCSDGTSPGVFYTCGGFLTITDNSPRNVGCAFGSNNQARLTAIFLP